MSNLLYRTLIMTMAVASLIMSGITIYLTYETHQINKETERILAEIENLERQNTTNTPRRTPSLNELNDVYYYSQVMPPSAAYPFGGYDGSEVNITILAESSVWESFDAMVRFDDFDRLLTDGERKHLVLNLTNALAEQENRNLDLVQPGDRFTLVLPYVYFTPELEWPLENQTPPVQVCPMIDPCVGDVEPTPVPIETVPSTGSNSGK